MPEYRITVLPYPGAVMTVKGFATDEYRRLLRLRRCAEGIRERLRPLQGLQAHVKRPAGAIVVVLHARRRPRDQGQQPDKIKKWSDLSGKKVYTGPLPFDTRLNLENAMAAVGVKHIYTQVDLSTAGSQLDSGSIEAMIIYTAGGERPAPWISEASLAVDWAALNPSADEFATLKKKGFASRRRRCRDLQQEGSHAKI